MASEDSDELGPVLSPVHRLRDLRDLDETRGGQMTAVVDHPDDLRELLEVRALRRTERMLFEERNDRLEEIRPVAHGEAIHGLTVVVVPSVRNEAAHAEEALQLMEASDAGRPLRDGELVSHLPAGSVGAPARPAELADKADREASFSVYKTKDPAKRHQPFLLVFRTVRVVTRARRHWRQRTTSTGRILGFSSI
jgi:hypothetical protein